MAIVIQPDGSNVEVLPEDGQRFTLTELQGFVGGYYVPVLIPADTKVNGYPIEIMYVNEDGLALDLEHNLNASMIADRHLVGNARVLFQGEQEDEDDE